MAAAQDPSNIHPTHGITNFTAVLANSSFDYVICGGGLTGLAVASLLSEDPDVSVLVIEAGYDRHEDFRVSDVRTYGKAFESELAHAIYSEPVSWQNNSGLLLVAGMMLGGSGCLNGASWSKGPKSQYDLLPMLTGDDSWGWDGLQKWMLKAERFHPPTPGLSTRKGARFDPKAHGTNGLVNVAFGSAMFGGTQLPALEASQRVWKNMSKNSDAASGWVNGATIIPNMVSPEDNQARSSPYTAYAEKQAQQRNNFAILTGHRVTEIVWQENKSGKLAAQGVQFQQSRGSPIELVMAKREVFLAAGSIQSPQILELSGVGRPEVLRAAGVVVKHALPGVGVNMQEQTKNTMTYTPRPGVDFEGSGPPSAISYVTAQQLLRDNATAWYNDTTSSLAAYASSLEAKGLVANASATRKVLQAQLDNLFHAPDSAAAEVFFTISPDSKNPQVGVDNWNLIVLSRGTAHIRSKDPWKYPAVQPSYFLHPLDLAFQTAVNQQSREVFNTPPLSSYVTHEITLGTQRVPQDADDKAWEDWVKGSFTSVWHYISTLSMMKEEMGGVVDERLRVYGIENVRVVDASVLPVQLSAHLSSSLYGIAEKGAAMIKEDWKVQK